ncbi:metal ABC transporter solute-binding protein, Zn/Mn family [Candidatus Nitrosacidococcus tergens]|uniref:High-affinity zinc uptake system protein ZnuA n=1 Tax=Candidatus Nitrosacidococcus tergens TaxID=553981 RepID=A0A7G1QBK8_9GAMM|nr:zinc ABC transporter substrate-binding protein [Candidatus Nitrosacidococcus tergens]CAB1276697.1 Periplasmic solute binding protein [Candidatus Nitrosacidococcus tergens]
MQPSWFYSIAIKIFLVISILHSTCIHAENHPIPIFVSIIPQKYFIERIGGSRVHVSVMIKQGQNEETYDPTPKQMVKLAQAEFYFRIGIPLEIIWLESIAKTNPHIKIIDNRNDIPLLPISADTLPEKIEDNGIPYESMDPHIWTSPPLVKIIAKNIRDTLITAEPTYKNQFEKNYQQFIQDLNNLDKFIRNTLSGITQHDFMVFHPAWRYFARTYGLHEIAIEHEGKEPGAKSLASFIELGRRKNIKTIFIQNQFSRTHAQLIAQSIGAKLISLDPLSEHYEANLRHVATTLASVLK